jgi:predicted site-specific integrase-resolvase
MTDQQFYTLSWLSMETKIPTTTLRRWTLDGRLACERTSTGGWIFREGAKAKALRLQGTIKRGRPLRRGIEAPEAETA